MKQNNLMDEVTWEGRLRLIFVTVFIVALLLLYDLASETSHWHRLSHLILEFVAILLLAALLAYLLKLLMQLRQNMKGLKQRLEMAEDLAKQWKKAASELARGVSGIIEQQFAAWKFSNAEQEVAMLLLKGLSFKEIAQLRQTSERTVRQQAQELYRKSGISGRAAFSAYFMEDLLVIPEK